MSRRRTSAVLSAALVTATLVMAACGSSSGDASSAAAAAAPGLAGTSWNLASYAGSDGASVTATPAPDQASLTFGTDGTWYGTTGCNRIAGSFEQDGSTLTLSPGPMTQMACEGAVADQEKAVVAALPLVSSIRSGDPLEFLSADGAALLSFVPGLAGLTGTAWRATGVNNGKEAVVSAEGIEVLTLSFDTADAASGVGGCNGFSASFTTTDPDGLTFGEVASTMKMCEEPVMQLEQQYFAALGNVATYQLEGGRLTLRDASGATQATFQQLP